MSAIWVEIRLAVLLLGAVWTGLMVIGRVEWVTILCSGAFIADAWARARAARRTRPIESAWWAVGILLAASIAMAGAFDYGDLGRGSAWGDWDTGFLFGAGLLLPSALVYVGLMVRERFRVQADPVEDEPRDDAESPRIAVLICTAVGVTMLGNELLGRETSEAVLVVLLLTGGAVAVSALLYRAITRRWGTPVQLLAEIAGCLAVSHGAVASDMNVFLGMLFLACLAFRFADQQPSLEVSTAQASPKRLLGAARYAAVNVLVAMGILVGLGGALGSRHDLSVAFLVSALDEAIPLSGAGFVNLIMRDEYLWSEEVSRRAGGGTKGAPPSLVKALRNPSDRWSGGYPDWYFQADQVGLQFGYGFELAELGSERIVSYVRPASAADQAGVRRGWRWLEATPAVAGAAPSASAHLFQDESGQQHRVELRGAWQTVPMVTSRVFDAAGKRIGYLFLHEFSEVAIHALRGSFADFKAAGVDELILDLRYNPGGSLRFATLVASLIGGQAVDGKVFQRRTHNEKYADNNGVVRFKVQPESLALSRVLVLTTGDTCSASEAVINGLAPYLDVVTIGGRTCGKPVGTSPKSFRGITYSVISFRIENGRGEGGYFQGIAPKCPVAEDFRADLGGRGDPLVDTALAYARDGRCPT